MKTSAQQPFEPTGDLAMRPEAVGLTWARAPREDQLRNGVAVIRVCGPLEHRGGWWFDSYESLVGRIEGAFQSDEVCAVVLDIDSPGGECSGLQETVRKIRAMRVSYDKPLIAFADDEAYSAAYALACSADEIYLPEGGGVGSVGVLATLCDRTAMTAKAGLRIEVVRSGTRKAEGHPDIPLSDETIGRVQARVDDLADQFFALVADVRPTSPKKLAALQGACLYGQAAVDAGLADGVASFDEVLSSLAEAEFDNSANRGVAFNPNDRSAEVGHGENMAIKAFAALEKKVAAALAALTAAKTPAAKKTTAAAYALAVVALTEAKVKKSYKKKTTEEETEEDDGEAEAEEETEDEETAEASGDDDEPDDDDDEGDDDEEDEKAKKGKAAASGSLASFVQSLTGKKSTAAARGVLQAMADMHARTAATEAQVERLKAEGVRKRRNDLIDAGMREGKLTPGQRAWAKTQSIASLKAYLETTAPRFAPRAPALPGALAESAGGTHDQGGVTLANEALGPDGLTETEKTICQMTGVSIEDFKARKAGSSAAQIAKVN